MLARKRLQNDGLSLEVHANGSEQQKQSDHTDEAPGWLPSALVSLLEDPSVIKAGVGCYEDGWVGDQQCKRT
jgi:hypothetical protein